MRKGVLVTGVEIVDIGAKGKVIGKKDGQTYLTQHAIPGDVVTLEIKKNKKSYLEGRVQHIDVPSPHTVDPPCKHQAYCGGCSWQTLEYKKQIELKARNVLNQLQRIGGISDQESLAILPAPQQFSYRNKLEFTFVDERWLTPTELNQKETVKKDSGLGFHIPGRFDWVLHIEECHLQDPLHNDMRNHLYQRALQDGISFYHPRTQEGTLRNVIFRNNKKGQWMVILVVKKSDTLVMNLCDSLVDAFPSIGSFWLVTNTKVNDSFADCPATLVHGDPVITETFNRNDERGEVQYRIGPKSFFQTNSIQAERLYQIVDEWANLGGKEVVYDLYTGTGSIALFVADRAKKVIGIEYVPEAIADAQENAKLNKISNCSFFAGDMKDILTLDFIESHGAPDVLITDPPRAGMHADVIKCILEVAPKRIVYVSCDPATQARDLAVLKEKYTLIKTQAVDMFPHTSHVENIALLTLNAE